MCILLITGAIMCIWLPRSMVCRESFVTFFPEKLGFVLKCNFTKPETLVKIYLERMAERIRNILFCTANNDSHLNDLFLHLSFLICTPFSVCPSLEISIANQLVLCYCYWQQSVILALYYISFILQRNSVTQFSLIFSSVPSFILCFPEYSTETVNWPSLWSRSACAVAL